MLLGDSDGECESEWCRKEERGVLMGRDGARQNYITVHRGDVRQYKVLLLMTINCNNNSR